MRVDAGATRLALFREGDAHARALIHRIAVRSPRRFIGAHAAAAFVQEITEDA